MDIRIDAHEVAGLAAAWKRAPGIIVAEMTAAILEASFLLEREIKERTPIGASGGSGGLKDSIRADKPRVLGERVIGEVATAVRYAIPVELGRRPGKTPPIAPLADWAHAKLGVPAAEAEAVGFAIARKIAARGTTGAFMFRDSFAATRPQIEGLFEAGARRALARIAAAGRA